MITPQEHLCMGEFIFLILIYSFLKDYIIARYEEDPTRNNQKLRFGTIHLFLQSNKKETLGRGKTKGFCVLQLPRRLNWSVHYLSRWCSCRTASAFRHSSVLLGCTMCAVWFSASQTVVCRTLVVQEATVKGSQLIHRAVLNTILNSVFN